MFPGRYIASLKQGNKAPDMYTRLAHDVTSMSLVSKIWWLVNLVAWGIKPIATIATVSLVLQSLNKNSTDRYNLWPFSNTGRGSILSIATR